MKPFTFANSKKQLIKQRKNIRNGLAGQLSSDKTCIDGKYY